MGIWQQVLEPDDDFRDHGGELALPDLAPECAAERVVVEAVWSELVSTKIP